METGHLPTTFIVKNFSSQEARPGPVKISHIEMSWSVLFGKEAIYPPIQYDLVAGPHYYFIK